MNLNLFLCTYLLHKKTKSVKLGATSLYTVPPPPPPISSLKGGGRGCCTNCKQGGKNYMKTKGPVRGGGGFGTYRTGT